MKKIFILTGEPSGDKLASKVISKLQKNNPNIEYSCVGGTHLNSLGIKSIFDLKEMDKNKVDKIVKDAEEGLKKENIKDHERYILDQKIEVLNSIKSN